MKRGFTIVEMLVVVGVLSIILTIAITGAQAYQKQADDAAAKTLAASIRSGVESYYAKNNEYPVPRDLMNMQGELSGPPSDSQYQIISGHLNIPTSALKNDRVRMVTCNNACLGTNLNKKYVYYLNKYAGGDNFTAYDFTFGSCTYSLPAAQYGAEAYVVAYWSHEANRWLAVKSNRGKVTTSHSFYCPLTTL